MVTAAFAGFFTGLSLIAAIGAQNAFVLRQGLRREHVAVVVLICALSDAILIAIGVTGFGTLSTTHPWVMGVMLWGGVAFLLVYGALRFQAARKGGSALMPARDAAVPLSRVVLICLTLTWANPHVYLDTVALLGVISTQYAPAQHVFGAGAVLASFAFFASLGYGARLLAPVFARPRSWVILEIVIGLVMWAIAFSLILRQFR